MRKLTTPATALATAALVLSGTTAAYAHHTVVTVNGSATPGTVDAAMNNITDPRNTGLGYAANAISFDTDYDVPINCETSSVSGAIHRGASVSVGNAIAHIGSLTLTNCTATRLEFDVDVTMSAQDINVRTHPANAGDPMPVDIQMDATFTGVGCDFDASGSIRGVIILGDSTNDGYIKLQPGYDLEIDRAGTSGTSCGGEIWEGDLAQATSGTFAITTSGPGAGPINTVRPHTQITVNGSATPGTVDAAMNNVNDARNAGFGYTANAVSFDTNFGVPINCETTAADLQIHRGANVSVGTPIGKIRSMRLTDCTMTALGMDLTLTFAESDIVVRDHPTNAGDQVPVDIQVDANALGVGCDFDLTGSVRGEFIPGDSSNDGYIELQPGYDLVIDRAGTSVASCGGEIWEGDLAQATTGIFALNTSGPGAGLVNHS